MSREKLMKMMSKKRDLSPHEKHAKMDVLKDLRGSVSDMMSDRLDGLKKVSVMSDSKEGLKHGLDKARGIVSDGEEHQMQKDAEAPYSDYKHAMEEHRGEEGGDSMGYNEGGEIEESPDHNELHGIPADEESPAHEASESPEEESEEHEDDEFKGLDLPEIEEKLQKLMEMKRQMESQES